MTIPWGLGEVTGRVVDVFESGRIQVAVPVEGSSGELLSVEEVTMPISALKPLSASTGFGSDALTAELLLVRDRLNTAASEHAARTASIVTQAIHLLNRWPEPRVRQASERPTELERRIDDLLWDGTIAAGEIARYEPAMAYLSQDARAGLGFVRSEFARLVGPKVVKGRSLDHRSN